MMRCGAVAIVGRPNVGKSTLLNHLIGQKISIVSRKPQTTRLPLKGILTTQDTQYVFVDTPGYQTRYGNALNRSMNRSVLTVLQGVDVVVFVVEALKWGKEDLQVLERIPVGVSPILVINKIDRVKEKSRLIPYLEDRARDNRFTALVPVSASHDKTFSGLLSEIRERLPDAPFLFEEDEITDSSERFLVAEFIRESLFRFLGEELPYSVSVMIEQYENKGSIIHIQAIILVDNENQKAIVIGHQGEKLKVIGTLARKNMEQLLQSKVHLGLWVKVKGGWADDQRILKQLGHDV